MDRALILFTTLMLFVAPGVNAMLSYASEKEFNITKTGCGKTKQCVETTDGCDPEGTDKCLFGSVNANTSMCPNSGDLAIELSGNSSGFIALGLTANASEGTSMLFVCAKNSSDKFIFQTWTRYNNNNTLTPLTRTVTEIRGKVDGEKIQCQFTVPNLGPTTTTGNVSITTFVILLGSGTVNENNLENFNINLTTKSLNFTGTLCNAATRTTPALHSQAVLLLLSMLTLSILKTA